MLIVISKNTKTIISVLILSGKNGANMPYQIYKPPILNLRVLLRNPSDKPPSTFDKYGVETLSPLPWGITVFAARRDLNPDLSYEEGLTVYESTTIWTIRQRPNVHHDVEVVNDDIIYESQGRPRIMGGANYGVLAKFFEIRTLRRT